MSNTFFSSDIHFGHANIIKYCDRPFSSIDEMDEAIIERHNSVVKPGDTWYFLGDLSFYKDHEKTRKLLLRMNGIKAWIPGNHDDPFVVLTMGMGVKEGLYEIKHLSRRPVTLCHFPCSRGTNPIVEQFNSTATFIPRTPSWTLPFDAWTLA